MTFTEVLKNCPAETIWALNENGNTHFFITTEPGTIMYLNPKTGFGKVIYRIYTGNLSTVFTYSHTKNAVYFFIGEAEHVLIQFELDNFKIKVFNIAKSIDTYTNYFTTPSAREMRIPHYVLPSTDGNIWFSNYRYRGIPGIAKFDTTTETFSTPGYLSDKEFEHLHGRQYVAAIKIDNTAFSGVYVNYLFDDSYEDIYTEVMAELASSGLTYTLSENFIIYAHWSDRAVGSSTRRVIVRAPNWRVIDLKSPSTYLDRQTSAGTIGITGSWVDQAATPVDSSGWSTGTLATYAAELGVLIPTFDSIIAYSRVRFVGRFPYQWGNYMANTTLIFSFAYDPDTGEALYPDSFNKLNTFLNNGDNPKVYVATMPTAQGFSANAEYIVFIQNEAGARGYYRPDTKAWTAYDPVADPNGYIISSVDLDDLDDPNGLGIYCQPYPAGAAVEYLNQTWQHSPFSNPAVNSEIITIVDEDRDICTVEVEYTPDVNTNIIKRCIFEGVGTATGLISCALEIEEGKFAFGGSRYSGISIGKEVAGEYQPTKYFGNALSIYNCVIFGDYILFSGYLGRVQVVDVSDIDNPILTDINWDINQYNTSLDVRSDGVICTGSGTRRPAYMSSYMRFGYVDTALEENLFADLPRVLDVFKTIELRDVTGLENESYDNAAVYSKLTSYKFATGQSWEDIKNLFTTTTPYQADGVVAYNNVIVVLLKHAGISALRGIQIPTNEDGTGVMITSDTGRSVHYPKVLWFEELNLVDLTAGNYKFIEIQAIGYGDSFGLAVLATDTYLCFLFNEGSNLVVRCISKANAERAAEDVTPITVLDKVITIPKGTTSGIWGNLLSGNNEYRKIGFAVGDNLFVTIKDTNIADGGNPAIALKIDVVAQTWEVFMTASDDATPTTMTYNATTDNVLATRGSTAELFEDISLATLPLTY